MPRGGPRPGAGAPKGNLNALKHGLRSQQFRRLAYQLAKSPTLRAALARFATLAARRQAALRADQACPEPAERAAALALATWLRYTRALERNEPWQGPAPPPPFSYRQARLLAKHLAHQTIKQGLIRYTHNPPQTDHS